MPSSPQSRCRRDHWTPQNLCTQGSSPMILGFSFCSIDQLLDLPDFRYTYTFSSRGFLNAIAKNPLPYVSSCKTSESFRIILHVIDNYYLAFAFHTWLLEKRGFTTEQVILCLESLVGMAPTHLSSLNLALAPQIRILGVKGLEGVIEASSDISWSRGYPVPWFRGTLIDVGK